MRQDRWEDARSDLETAVTTRWRTRSTKWRPGPAWPRAVSSGVSGKATGYSPIAYVQNLRIAEARRRLEWTDVPVEQIGYDVGYENTAFFRRVFKRYTRLTPGAYRRKFQMPGIDQARV